MVKVSNMSSDPEPGAEAHNCKDCQRLAKEVSFKVEDESLG